MDQKEIIAAFFEEDKNIKRAYLQPPSSRKCMPQRMHELDKFLKRRSSERLKGNVSNNNKHREKAFIYLIVTGNSRYKNEPSERAIIKSGKILPTWARFRKIWILL